MEKDTEEAFGRTLQVTSMKNLVGEGVKTHVTYFQKEVQLHTTIL